MRTLSEDILNKFEGEQHDFAAIRDIQEEFSLYGSYLILSVINGVIKNIGAPYPEVPSRKVKKQLQKANRDQIARYLRRMRRIIGDYSKYSPDDPFVIGGKPIYKRGGVPMTMKEWQALDKKINDYVSPRLSGMAEEIVAKTYMLAMFNLEAQLQAKDVDDWTYKEAEARRFGGALPNTIEAVSKRYEMPKEVKDQMNISAAKVGDYITEMEDELRLAVRRQILDAYEKKKTPIELASDLYWSKDDDPAVNQYTAEILARNWRRVAYTELAMLHEQSRSAAMDETARQKPVYLVFAGTADGCEVCRAFLGEIVRQIPPEKVEGNTDSLKSLGIDDPITNVAVWTGKTNVGFSQKNWRVCCPVHPYCQHRFQPINPDTQEYDEKSNAVRFKTTEGEKFFEKLMEGHSIFKEIESNRAANQRRKDLMETDRRNHVYKRDSEYYKEEKKKA